MEPCSSPPGIDLRGGSEAGASTSCGSSSDSASDAFSPRQDDASSSSTGCPGRGKEEAIIEVVAMTRPLGGIASQSSAPTAHEASQVPDEDDRLDPALETVSILAHLAVFAILGVCIRYSLEILFGPQVAHVTDDNQAFFLDVPANMAGSFLMGVLGFTHKKDIAAYSQPLAIGLSTGLCGSITTYASWNQRMASILAYGLVMRALFGYILGTALAWHSFSVGVDVANWMRELLRRHNERRLESGRHPWAVQPEHYQRRWASLMVAVAAAITLWAVAGIVYLLEPSSAKLRKVSLGCLLGPFGCWLRWFLSFRNGKGLGKQHRWQWIPFGTLAANLIAVCLEAATSSIDSVHDTVSGSILLGGIQVGFLGCLSTVSALMLEIHVLVRAKAAQWRGYLYLYGITFLPSIVLAILLYCIPVWIYGVADSGYNKV